MTTIYLHIGMPKTGTTSLQHFLKNNQEKLLEEGYLYPKSGRIPTADNITVNRLNHHSLASALLRKYAPKAATPQSAIWEGSWESLKIEIEMIKPKNVIISSEHFTITSTLEFYNPDIIAMLKKMLEQYEAKIIIYIRRQDEFFRSMYCQEIKTHCESGIREFILHFKNKANYHQILEVWKNEFGLKNVIVRPFEKEQLKNGDIVDDFLESINLNLNKNEMSFDFNPSMKNVSHSGKIIKLINLIKKKVDSGSPKKTTINIGIKE